MSLLHHSRFGCRENTINRRVSYLQISFNFSVCFLKHELETPIIWKTVCFFQIPLNPTVESAGNYDANHRTVEKFVHWITFSRLIFQFPKPVIVASPVLPLALFNSVMCLYWHRPRCCSSSGFLVNSDI